MIDCFTYLHRLGLGLGLSSALHSELTFAFFYRTLLVSTNGDGLIGAYRKEKYMSGLEIWGESSYSETCLLASLASLLILRGV